jgi:hypothetical protein
MKGQIKKRSSVHSVGLWAWPMLMLTANFGQLLEFIFSKFLIVFQNA